MTTIAGSATKNKIYAEGLDRRKLRHFKISGYVLVLLISFEKTYRNILITIAFCLNNKMSPITCTSI